jgi:hypothetical protein
MWKMGKVKKNYLENLIGREGKGAVWTPKRRWKNNLQVGEKGRSVVLRNVGILSQH